MSVDVVLAPVTSFFLAFAWARPTHQNPSYPTSPQGFPDGRVVRFFGHGDRCGSFSGCRLLISPAALNARSTAPTAGVSTENESNSQATTPQDDSTPATSAGDGIGDVPNIGANDATISDGNTPEPSSDQTESEIVPMEDVP